MILNGESVKISKKTVCISIGLELMAKNLSLDRWFTRPRFEPGATQTHIWPLHEPVR
jgi:hypothetical protein